MTPAAQLRIVLIQGGVDVRPRESPVAALLRATLALPPGAALVFEAETNMLGETDPAVRICPRRVREAAR